jgi:hypothetical protein
MAAQTKFIVGYNIPGYLPDEPPFEYDTFEEAKNEVLWHLNMHVEQLDNASLTSLYEARIKGVENWKEEDAPVSCKIGGYIAWIQKSDNNSTEE